MRRRPIFAKTRHLYDSYTDYRRLIELSGFETCYVDQMDLTAPDAVYVVSPVNGELHAHMAAHGANRKSRIVWWNLERPDMQGAAEVGEMLGLVDEVWVSDRYYASLDARQRFVTLGSHPLLGAEPFVPQYDFTHQSYVWGRRGAMVEGLRRRGFKEGPNAWTEKRDHVLRRSRIMVNVHQTPAPIGEPLRFALAAAYWLPLVTETLADGFPLVEGVDYIEAPQDAVPEKAAWLLGQPEVVRARLGTALHKRLCVEHPFRRGIEEALGAMLH